MDRSKDYEQIGVSNDLDDGGDRFSVRDSLRSDPEGSSFRICREEVINFNSSLREILSTFSVCRTNG